MEETVFGNILNYRSVSVLVVVGFLVRIYLKILKYSVCLNGNVDTPSFLTLKVTILTLNSYF